jgi:RND family efflux transporter MFP subunit
MKNALLLLPLPLAIACGSGPTDASGPAPTAEAAPVRVTTATARTAPMPTRIPLVGSLVAARQAQVAADTTGVVVEARVERGETVKKGDVLVVIDSRTARFSAQASEAQAVAQAAQADLAARECTRANDLYAQGVLSKAQFERTQASCEAQSRVADAARASAELAGSNADRTKVKAPFSGVVGERMVEVGTFVQAASPVASLYADGPLRVRLSVPETQSGGITEGSAVTVFPTALDGVEVPATVKYVAGAIREQTRDLIVEAELADEDVRLRPGMSVRVELEVGRTPAVVVPEAAVRMIDGAPNVFVVRDGIAIQRVVRAGSRSGGDIAVLSDVSEGDVVVLDPPADLRDGARVN